MGARLRPSFRRREWREFSPILVDGPSTEWHVTTSALRDTQTTGQFTGISREVCSRVVFRSLGCNPRLATCVYVARRSRHSVAPMILRGAWRVFLIAALAAAALTAAAAAETATASAVTLSAAAGQGSSYVALAFQEWTEEVQSDGLNVQYTPTSSTAGLDAYANGTADFAGSEAEYSELDPEQPVDVPRGYAYAPDVRRGHRDHVQRRPHRQRAGPHQHASALSPHRGQDLLGPHHQLGRPGHQRRQRWGHPSRRAHHRGLSGRAIGNDSPVLRLHRPHRPHGLRRLGGSERLLARLEAPRGR